MLSFQTQSMDDESFNDFISLRILYDDAFELEDGVIENWSTQIRQCNHPAFVECIEAPFRLDFSYNDETGCVTWNAVKRDIAECFGRIEIHASKQPDKMKFPRLVPIHGTERFARSVLANDSLKEVEPYVYESDDKKRYNLNDMTWSGGALRVVFIHD